MTRLSHEIEYLATLTGAKLAGLLSMRTADRFGAFMGRIAHAVLTSRRRIALDNLKQAFGDEYSEEELKAITRRVFENFGRTTVEFARFDVLTTEKMASMIDGDTSDLQKLQDEGRGGIIVTAHSGNFELLGPWLAVHVPGISLLVGRQHNEKVNRYLVDLRRGLGVGIIEIPSEVRRVFKVLKANGFVGMISDQHSASGPMVVEFFGRPAATPRGPALFAVRTGRPILGLLIRRERYDRHIVFASRIFYPPATGDEEADIQSMTQEYTRFFEDGIRQYPDQWLWTHRRWKV